MWVHVAQPQSTNFTTKFYFFYQELVKPFKNVCIKTNKYVTGYAEKCKQVFLDQTQNKIFIFEVLWYQKKGSQYRLDCVPVVHFISFQRTIIRKFVKDSSAELTPYSGQRLEMHLHSDRDSRTHPSPPAHLWTGSLLSIVRLYSSLQPHSFFFQYTFITFLNLWLILH